MQEARGIALQDNDVVSISFQPNRPQIRIVNIQGEVLRPGLYPIENNRTTLDAILEQAGGIKSDACLQRIAVIRKKKQQELETIIRSPANQALESITATTPLALTARPEISSSFSELLKTRDYLVISPASTNAPIILTEGDMVVVPKKEGLIHIHGHVKKPGAYPLKENASQRAYINSAGGLSKKADRSNIYVVRQYGDAMHILESPTIVDGDIILVPMGQENKQLTRIILPVLSTAATVINVFLAVLALNN
jgi:protein involved in polysaccharide export with SLBB domain